jgi:hypothetical protein
VSDALAAVLAALIATLAAAFGAVAVFFALAAFGG